MEGLIEGRIVHYTLDDKGTHRPAIVVKVLRQTEQDAPPIINGACDLMVFLDKDDAGFPFQFTSSCINSENKIFDTWHWIERS